MIADAPTAGSIVVAYDGSGHAERALEWAAVQAHHEGRQLSVVHALGADQTRALDLGSATGADLMALRDSLRAAARSRVEHAVAGVGARLEGLDVHGYVVPGDPRSALLDLSHAAHMLVLGSHGHGPVRALLLGSVSAAVSRHAECPVVVTRPERAEVEQSLLSEGIVVGADGTVDSLPVIEFAFRQASLRSRRLTVVHCYRDIIAGAGFAVAVPVEETADLPVVLAQSLAGMAEKFPDVEVASRLERGLAGEVLTGRTHPHAWELVVVGRHHKSAWERILVGSVSGAVLEHARTTVAVVPESIDARRD